MKKNQLDPKLGASLMKLGGDKRLSGLSSGALRLSSLRPARDLSLGATPKRTFTPNIPARRVKEEPGPSTATESTPVKTKDQRRHEKPQGRGRGRREIVSSASIFSHGPFAGSRSGGVSKAEKYDSSRDKLSMKAIMGGSKSGEDITDESQKVLDMLKDEGRIRSEHMDAGSLMPITIPLANSKLMGKKEESDDRIVSNDTVDDDEESISVKLGSPSRLAPSKSAVHDTSHKTMAQETVTCAELFKGKSREDTLLFFQFPDALPINTLASDKCLASRQKKAEGSSGEFASAKDGNIEESLKKFSFQNVSEGYIGKLQVHKSGRVRLLLGNATLDVSMGIPCGFLQDLVSVHSEEERREMLSLGQLSHRLICTPNYDDLLGSLGDAEE